MEMDIEYDGDCTLEMEVGTSLANIPLGIKDIKLSGTMRIELRDMVPCSPLISAIVAYFIDPPKMDFDLTGTANVADHPWIASTGMFWSNPFIQLCVEVSICVVLARPLKTKEGPLFGLYLANPESIFYVRLAYVSTLPKFLLRQF